MVSLSEVRNNGYFVNELVPETGHIENGGINMINATILGSIVLVFGLALIALVIWLVRSLKSKNN